MLPKNYDDIRQTEDFDLPLKFHRDPSIFHYHPRFAVLIFSCSSLLALRMFRRARQPRGACSSPDATPDVTVTVTSVVASGEHSKQVRPTITQQAGEAHEDENAPASSPTKTSQKPSHARRACCSCGPDSVCRAPALCKHQLSTVLLATLRQYFRAFWNYDANFWICLARFSSGAFEGCLVQFLVFYLMYVSQVGREDRSFWLGAAGLSTGLVLWRSLFF